MTSMPQETYSNVTVGCSVWQCVPVLMLPLGCNSTDVSKSKETYSRELLHLQDVVCFSVLQCVASKETYSRELLHLQDVYWPHSSNNLSHHRATLCRTTAPHVVAPPHHTFPIPVLFQTRLCVWVRKRIQRERVCTRDGLCVCVCLSVWLIVCAGVFVCVCVCLCSCTTAPECDVCL